MEIIYYCVYGINFLDVKYLLDLFSENDCYNLFKVNVVIELVNFLE